MTRFSIFVVVLVSMTACSSSDGEDPAGKSGPWKCFATTFDNVDFDGNPTQCTCYPPDVQHDDPDHAVPSCTGIFSPYESVCWREPQRDWVPPSCSCHQVMCGTETVGDLAGVCRCARTGLFGSFNSTSCEGAVCCAGKWDHGSWECRCGDQACPEGTQQVDRCDASTVPIGLSTAELVDSCDIVEP